MKIHLKLISNKNVPIDVNFETNKDPSSSTMIIKEHTEQMLEVEFKVFKNSNINDFVVNLRRVIQRKYPNVTSIEGLQQIDALIK